MEAEFKSNIMEADLNSKSGLRRKPEEVLHDAC